MKFYVNFNKANVIDETVGICDTFQRLGAGTQTVWVVGVLILFLMPVYASNSSNITFKSV